MTMAVDKDTVQFNWTRVWFRKRSDADDSGSGHYTPDEQQEARAIVGALMLLRDIVNQASKSYYLQKRNSKRGPHNDLFIKRTGLVFCRVA